ncbi:hypothetical protein PVAP13_3KG127052 [Panicum virgatum]|uniref:Uncharacterized protein n=1 Tax=Panicum virgatum TaxID=38727 RepID=A0A8T0V266_PANVG|nr:hypothetical protein PVAP13_3KG127052 [Panicum virgatum]
MLHIMIRLPQQDRILSYRDAIIAASLLRWGPLPLKQWLFASLKNRAVGPRILGAIARIELFFDGEGEKNSRL